MTERIGERVRVWRRRRGGMSQQTLADLAGFSQAYISQIERGKHPLDQRSTQVAIATALNISVSQLLGQPMENGDPERRRATAHVPAIRSALVELGAGERRTPGRDRDTLRVALDDARDLRNGAQYSQVAPVLPGLLLDLAGHGTAATPELVEALFHTQVTLKNIGYRDLSREAAHVSMALAKEYDDPVWLGLAWHAMVLSFPPENADLGARLAMRAADGIQGATDRRAQEAYGFLHLLAALHAATSSRQDDAWSHVREAAEVAASLGDPERVGAMSAGFGGLWFGSTNVDFWRVAVAAELGEAGVAIDVGNRTNLAAVPVPSRQTYFHLDTARALAADGSRDREAMHAVAKAERAAPLHFRFSPVAMELPHTLVRRARRRDADEMVRLARRLGLLI